MTRIIGRASKVTSVCDSFHCRRKRQVDSSRLSTHEIRIETPKAIFDHQHGTNEHGDHVIQPLMIKLHLKSGFPLIAPHYKLIVRDGDGKRYVNTTVPFPNNCLFNGTLQNNDDVQIALSTCGQKMSGIMIHSNRKFVIETLSEDHPEYSRARVKRDMSLVEDFDQNLVLIYETSGGKCGLKPYNMKKMHAPPLEESIRTLLTRDNVRVKRQTERGKALKAIEIAIFVDDDLYQKTESSGVKDPVKTIQDFVFAYLNSVQLLYQSTKLDTNFQIILVRLEIFTGSMSKIDKNGGDIESYLESFCKWQSKENPEHWDKLSRHPDHWDHGLLLTGLNLYDVERKFSSVIGLAWVSGMCHPEYSCTINEGNNFESVYVIAHEMGHNLGMNHDGESDVGNNCDPDMYLMSPVLGPGKVTWSPCSNEEIRNFLTDRSTKDQAVCLDDLPPTVARYDFLRDGQRPGEQFNAFEQCQQAYGNDFIPHVKTDSPFEDLCRELWCANSTHALRAHPALEGTDCSAKPYPYGSFCIEGNCVPFYPDDVKPINDNTGRDKDTNGVDYPGENTRDSGSPSTEGDAEPGMNLIDGRPAWYDPIYTEIFIELKMKFAQRFDNAHAGNV